MTKAEEIKKAINDSAEALFCGHTEVTFNLTDAEIMETKIDQILENQIVILGELLSIRIWNG